MLNTVILVLWVLLISGVMIVPILFFTFTRRGKNLRVKILSNAKYVVVHMYRDATDNETIYNVVPSADFYTMVGDFAYNLNPKYAIMRFQGRLHFRITVNDSIPQYFGRTESKEEVLQQTDEITNALHNRAYDFLYQKNKNLALIICSVALAISILTSLYAIYKFQQVTPFVEWLYAHPPSNIADPIVEYASGNVSRGR